jgi:hypothetical protein
MLWDDHGLMGVEHRTAKEVRDPKGQEVTEEWSELQAGLSITLTFH